MRPKKLSLSGLALKAMDNARMTLEGGVVAVRDCGGKDYVDLDVRDALNAGRFPRSGDACIGQDDLHDRRARQQERPRRRRL